MLKATLILIATATAFLAISVPPGAAQTAPAPSVQKLEGLCAQMGLASDQFDFVYCVESLKNSAGTLLNHRSGYNAEAAPMYGDRSGQARPLVYGRFAETSFYGSDQRMRESRACVGLGLPIGTRAFGQCVADLDATMTYVQNRGLAD
jgi:hypothetical protein